MASFRRLISSRANARRSTGPKTTAGKQRSSQNARVHGCRSRTFQPPQDHDQRRQFDELRAGFYNSFQPANITEIDSVERMVQARWQENVLCQLQSRMLKDVIAAHPAGHFGDDQDTPARVAVEALENPRFRSLMQHEDRQ